MTVSPTSYRGLCGLGNRTDDLLTGMRSIRSRSLPRFDGPATRVHLVRVERLLAAHALPPRGHAGIRLRVDSQQTVDRDFDGSWQLHDQ